MRKLLGNAIAFGLALSLVGTATVGIVGATPWQSSGNSMWFASEAIVDADGDFNTAPVHLGASMVGCIALVVSDFNGTKVDCDLYSGVTSTVANGTKTGASFTQMTGTTAEMVCETGGEFLPYLWATCGEQSTAGSITLGAFTVGKL